MEERKWSIGEVLAKLSENAPAVYSELANDVHLNLFCVDDRQGDLVVLSRSGLISVVNLVSEEKKQRTFKLDLNAQQLQQIHSLKFDTSGRQILLRGQTFCQILTLPQRKMANSSTPVKQSKKDTPVNSSLSLLPIGFFDGTDEKLRIRHADWHPLSDTHVVVLTSSEELRVYDILSGSTEEPEQTHRLQRPPIALEEHRKDFQLDEKAFASYFSFGSGSGWENFTCYILYTDGSIFSLCPVVPYECQVPAGNIRELKNMVEAIKDNFKIAQDLQNMSKDHGGMTKHEKKQYLLKLKAQLYWLNQVWSNKTNPVGTPTTTPTKSSGGRFGAPNSRDNDPTLKMNKTRRLLEIGFVKCLKPHISGISSDTWPVALQGPVALSPKSEIAGKSSISGGASGSCLLSIPNNNSDNPYPVLARMFTSGHLEVIILDNFVQPLWKISHDEVNVSQLDGYLIECLSLGVDDSNGATYLQADQYNSHLFYCFHSTGVHLINMQPWLSSSTDLFITQKPESSVRQLFSVSPSFLGQHRSSIIGCQIVKNITYGHILLVQLGCGSFEVINVSSFASPLLFAPPLANGQDVEEGTSNQVENQLKLTSFTDDVAKLQQRRVNVRTVVTGSTQLADADDATVQFLIDQIKSFHQSDLQYIQQLDKLLKNRLRMQVEVVCAQQDKIRYVRSGLDQTSQKAELLDSKMKKCLAIHDNLKKRAAAVMQAVKENQPCLSKAEKKYKEELLQMELELRPMRPKIAEVTMKASLLLKSGKSPLKTPMKSLDNTLSSEKKEMCFDVLSAEKILIEDSKKKITSLQQKIDELKLI